MLDQFGTINVREARLTKAEVEQLLGEVLERRGPDAYEFAYSRPIFMWDNKGGVCIRWPAQTFYDEPGRKATTLVLKPWNEYAKEQAARLQKQETERQEKEAKGDSKP